MQTRSCWQGQHFVIIALTHAPVALLVSSQCCSHSSTSAASSTHAPVGLLMLYQGCSHSSASAATSTRLLL